MAYCLDNQRDIFKQINMINGFRLMTGGLKIYFRQKIKPRIEKQKLTIIVGNTGQVVNILPVLMQ